MRSSTEARHTIALGLVALAVGAGCQGLVEDATPTSHGPGTRTRIDPDDCELAPPTFEVGTRLSRAEYARTARDLLGVDGDAIVATFPEDERVGTTGFTVGRSISPALATAQLDAAEALADALVRDLDRHLPCDPTLDGERACAEEWARTFGRRAWRRPLSDDEVTRVMALYDEGAMDGGFASGVELAASGMFAAPWFLYHVEARTDDVAGAIVTRTGFELASRMSYLLWGSMPDDALLDAAEAGRLATAEDAAREARRMVDDARAREGVLAFFDGWLELDRIDGIQRDTERYPAATPELARSLHGSTEAFVEWAFWEGGTFEDLFRSDRVFADARMRALYGGEASGDAFEPFQAEERRGLLTQPGLLALHALHDQSSPIQRGVFVRTQILCQPLQSPPMNVNVRIPPPEPGLSTRERFAAHTADPGCASCHRLIDPIGFSFERYDAIGAYRTMEDGIAIDATGELTGTYDADGPIDGAVELADRLAGSEEVMGCYVEQWARYALARPIAEDERCALADLQRMFTDSGGDLRELLVSLAASPLVMERRVADDLGAP
ncbi:MAG: DUF1592 domain-containing protein [Sandaracinaceae bacterium]